MRKPADPDLHLIAIRLRKDDIDRAKQIAKREKRPYQQWIRERVAEAVRQRGELRPYKLSVPGGAVVVMAETATKAVSLAEEYGKQWETESGYRPGLLTFWLRQAEVAEAPVKPGVVAWAQTGFARRA